jgi:hypothetical protein
VAGTWYPPRTLEPEGHPVRVRFTSYGPTNTWFCDIDLLLMMAEVPLVLAPPAHAFFRRFARPAG